MKKKQNLYIGNGLGKRNRKCSIGFVSVKIRQLLCLIDKSLTFP